MTELMKDSRGHEYRIPPRGTWTPWDFAQTVRDYGLGIKCYTTASHGGFFVPIELMDRVSAWGRKYAERWSGSQLWFEEDCAWAYVADAFPELFGDEEKAAAIKTIEWIRKEYSDDPDCT